MFSSLLFTLILSMFPPAYGPLPGSGRVPVALTGTVKPPPPPPPPPCRCMDIPGKIW